MYTKIFLWYRICQFLFFASVLLSRAAYASRTFIGDTDLRSGWSPLPLQCLLCLCAMGCSFLLFVCLMFCLTNARPGVSAGKDFCLAVTVCGLVRAGGWLRFEWSGVELGWHLLLLWLLSGRHWLCISLALLCTERTDYCCACGGPPPRFDSCWCLHLLFRAD